MLKQCIGKISKRQNLDFQEAYASVGEIIGGGASEAQIAAFLTGLSVKGETPAEISGGAKCLIDHARQINTQGSFCVDPVGTGGDSTGTFNISSCAALVAAAAGTRIAKHGNRAVSSKCGSADFYEALGLDINLKPLEAQRCLDEHNFVFLYAPVYHPAMKHAAPVRRQLGIRTLFNLLGPLANPARARGVLLGVYSGDLLNFMAEALLSLGVERGMVVHGHDGADEISLTSPTDVCEIFGSQMREYTISPEDLGFNRCSLKEISGGSPQENVQILLDIVQGCKGPHRDIVMLNAGAVLYIAGIADNLNNGIDLASRAVDSGAAREKLEQLRLFCQNITAVRRDIS